MCGMPWIKIGHVFFAILCFKKNILFIYFLERGERKEKETERNISVWLPLVHPLLGAWPGPQPRHVPWLEIEPATLWFAGWSPIHWATQARALPSFSSGDGSECPSHWLGSPLSLASGSSMQQKWHCAISRPNRFLLSSLGISLSCCNTQKRTEILRLGGTDKFPAACSCINDTQVKKNHPDEHSHYPEF